MWHSPTRRLEALARALPQPGTRLERINDIFREMKQSRIDGRIVLQF